MYSSGNATPARAKPSTAHSPRSLATTGAGTLFWMYFLVSAYTLSKLGISVPGSTGSSGSTGIYLFVKNRRTVSPSWIKVASSVVLGSVSSPWAGVTPNIQPEDLPSSFSPSVWLFVSVMLLRYAPLPVYSYLALSRQALTASQAVQSLLAFPVKV